MFNESSVAVLTARFGLSNDYLAIGHWCPFDGLRLIQEPVTRAAGHVTGRRVVPHRREAADTLQP